MTTPIGSRDANVWPSQNLPARVVFCSSPPERHSIEQALRDGVITAKIKAGLRASPVAGHHQILVETFQASVQLSGYIESDDVRVAVLQIVCGTTGVAHVHDLMDVRNAR